MTLPGDLYHIHYSVFGSSHTFEARPPCDTWPATKTKRNDVFYSNTEIRACWVMKRNVSLQLEDEKWGATLRRHRRKARAHEHQDALG